MLLGVIWKNYVVMLREGSLYLWTDSRINSIQTFFFSLTEDIFHIDYKYQSIDAVTEVADVHSKNCMKHKNTVEKLRVNWRCSKCYIYLYHSCLWVITGLFTFQQVFTFA
jgi:hypothetical protein